MKRNTIEANLDRVFTGIEDHELPGDISFIKGKVRDIIDFKDSYLLVTSDRISAFDRVLTTIPFKGQVLHQMSMYWFEKTRDIIPNHVEKEINSRTVQARKCTVLPVEVVVRGYLTGSAWRDYQSSGEVSGIKLPDGMKMNQRFPEPLLTPSTKAERGDHDIPISSEQVVKDGLIEKRQWDKVVKTAYELFARGTAIAKERGLILVDTKYEFGTRNGEIVLVDELHTPDSSRYWFADTYEELFERGEKQRKIDKEYLRQWLMEKGFMGDGAAPDIPPRVRTEVAERYIKAYELITGREFTPSEASPDEEKQQILSYVTSGAV